QYFTDYAKEKFEPIKQEQIKIAEEKYGLSHIEPEKPAPHRHEEKEEHNQPEKKTKPIVPSRGIETMFRTTSANHFTLSSMADSKANIMISVNSIIISITVSVLFDKLTLYPYLIIPTAMLICVCLSTIIFAILATRPNVSGGVFTKEDIEEKKTNLLFFGNFHKMRLEEYQWGMKEMMKDSDYLYGSMIKDIYFLGVVLARKYRYLRISYTIFMFGLIVAISAFAVAFAFQ
ncbi:MAG: HD family phosphohydrolase, partial [Gemmatimonadaceae bacterium]|nr:HD family phosphohydrolase [Chitinophagaceae bacterium]